MSGSERERLGQRDLVGVLESHGARRAAWAASGGEWSGSCPQIDGRGCGGGTDRAHVTAAGVYGCRRCPDRGRAVWAAAQRAHMADSAPAAPHLGAPPAAAEAAPADRTAKVAAARRVWADAHPVADTPAHAYLAARGVWPSGWAPSADMVRWYAPTDAEVLRRIGWAKAGRAGAVGALVWPLSASPGGEPVGVELEALRRDGRRCGPDTRPGSELGRWRRTLGVRAGAMWAATLRTGDRAHRRGVVLEGPVDGLAAAALSTAWAKSAQTRAGDRLADMWRDGDGDGDVCAAWLEVAEWIHGWPAVAGAALIVAAPAAGLAAAAVVAARECAKVLILPDGDIAGACAGGDAAAAAHAAGAVTLTLRPWRSGADVPRDLAAASARWRLLDDA